jgi:hypothetical protein
VKNFEDISNFDSYEEVDDVSSKVSIVEKLYEVRFSINVANSRISPAPPISPSTRSLLAGIQSYSQQSRASERRQIQTICIRKMFGNTLMV